MLQLCETIRLQVYFLSASEFRRGGGMFHCLQRTIANRYDLLAIAMPRRSVIFGNAVASRLDVAGNVLATQVIRWSLAR